MSSPTVKVLSTLQTHGVRYLLMGGQACIVYGAAEFSRDTDIAILAEPENLKRLDVALATLDARVLAVPPFEPEYLARGHAVHFECGPASVAPGMRLDVMAVMRNVPAFDICWARRSTLAAGDLDGIEVMGLEDLVNCKKTRRDKDWPMLRVLVERHYLDDTLDPTVDRFRFWLRELRTPPLVAECIERARTHSAAARDVLADVAAHRDVTAVALRGGSSDDIAAAIAIEEAHERAADDAYWQPLIRELEALRHAARSARVTPASDSTTPPRMTPPPDPPL